MTSLGRVWNLRGVKPVIKTIMKFDYTYLYKAVNPKTGESFDLTMPVINTNGMNKFLEEFKKYIRKREVILIMDNAPSHKSKYLKVPEGIEIEYLPPYSPQLNPVERVFQDIKKHFKNKVFDSLDKLEDKLFEVLNSLSNEYLKSLTFYPYIKEAFDMN
ncbi:IS630 family transposase [Persephonella sp.]